MGGVIDYKKLGERIREERHNLHLTQFELATDIDVSPSYMGAIERGERGASLETMVLIARRLGVTIDYLLTEAGDSSNTDVVLEFRRVFNKLMGW